jgi:hypothetical protein
MNKREAKIKALEIASIVISELESSDCTDSLKIKNELYKIAVSLAKRADKLKELSTNNK